MSYLRLYNNFVQFIGYAQNKQSQRVMNKVIIRKQQKSQTMEELESLSKDELIKRVLTLEAHNLQLRNIVSKANQNDRRPDGKKSKQFDFSKYEFRHVLLKFLYLGWDYQGYVVQEDTTNTIEHQLFDAFAKTCLIKSREESNYHRCGRTDKGVSSFSQVISIDLRSKLSYEDRNNLDEETDYCKVLNCVLPETIQCIAWAPVGKEVSARFDCKSRSYKYFFPKGHLNIQKMQTACKFLIGTHDFRNFCKMDVANGVTEFIRNVSDAKIESAETTNIDNSEYDMYLFVIKSKGFLWHQIRCIMGILFLIGEEHENPEIIRDLLQVSINSRKPDYAMAHEMPLNLFSCEYEDVNENWQCSETALENVKRKLQGHWTLNNVKSTMIKAMLAELVSLSTQLKPPPKDFSNILNMDRKGKRYIPLLERPKCDSLEDKIEHFLKRRRIQLKQDVIIEATTSQ